MKIIQLSEAEAANPTIVALVAQQLFDGGVSLLTQEDKRPKIAPEDLPSAGFPPDPPMQDAYLSGIQKRDVPVDPTTLGFGAAAQQSLPMSPPAPVSAPAVAAAPSVELDKHGLPWDARIHSGGENKKNADGSWRKKRGVDDLTVARIEAELRQAMSIPAIVPAPVAAPPMPPVDDHRPKLTPVSTAQPPVAPAVPVQVAPPAPTLAPAADAITFDGWMKELTGAMSKQWVTTGLFNTLIEQCYPGAGATLQAIVMRPELIPPVRAAMAAHLDANHPGWREQEA